MDQKAEIIAGGKSVALNVCGRWLIFFSILVGLGVTIYAEPLYALTVSVLKRRASSHGLFVPFISGYFIWLKLDKIRKVRYQIALLPGAAMVMAGFALYYLNQGGPGFTLPVLSFLLIAAGLMLIFFGWKLFKEVSFPLFFLAAMIPLPEAVYIQMADTMRQVTTWTSVTLLNAIGISIHRDGFNIYLPDIHLHVDHGCSGIRVLLSYFAFGLAYAVRFKQSNRARLLVLAVAIPLALTHNIVRLCIIFISVQYIGPVLTDSYPHVLFSWSVFATLLVAAIAADRLLSKKH
jgi:exosortase